MLETKKKNTILAKFLNITNDKREKGHTPKSHNNYALEQFQLREMKFYLTQTTRVRTEQNTYD